MASGLGRRFGGNKLLAQLAGKPLLQWVLEATSGVFPRRVVVTRHPQVAQLCRALGADVLCHELPYRSDTVRLGLDAVGADAAGCLFCAGDQPLLHRETVQAMALAFSRDPESIWRLSYGETAGAPVLFPPWAFDQLRQLPQGKGGQALLARYPHRVRTLPARSPWELTDVDTPSDLARLAAYLNGLDV
jgi:molybdenum cofactor cytidylyltransferase